MISDERRVFRWATAALLIVIGGLFAAGCTKAPPPVVPVSGRVMLDGKPVPLAQVTFYPLFAGFGGEVIAEGVTDENGRYELSCPLGAGGCVGRHKVTVSDAPSPDQAREQSAEGTAAMRTYLRQITNRPLGTAFATLATTPLEVDVTDGGGPYDLTLTR